MSHYDYIIVGGGCAGLSLAVQLVEAFGNQRKVLIIDPAAKTQNDRSWAFWSKNNLPMGLDQIVCKRWTSLHFGGASFERRVQIAPYTYRFIQAIDYYRYMQDKLRACPQVSWRQAKVEAVGQTDTVAWARVGAERLRASHVFDSRPRAGLGAGDTSTYFLWQHFYGYRIRTEQAIFAADTATLMDFRGTPSAYPAFHYVLPLNTHEALVEYTAFSANLSSTTQYQQELHQYCQQVLGLSKYDIQEVEQGKIPMTNATLYPAMSPGSRVVPIGTAAGCVKPTTGYAFLRIHAHNKELVQALQKHEPLLTGDASPARFAWYDALLLRILSDYPERGAGVFSALFRHTDFRTILRFLDEGTGAREEVDVFRHLPISLFLRAAWWHLRQRPVRHLPGTKEVQMPQLNPHQL